MQDKIERLGRCEKGDENWEILRQILTELIKPKEDPKKKK